MWYRKAERVVVQTEDYNQYHFEVEVSLDHRDIGISNDGVALLSEDSWEENWAVLKKRADDEVDKEVAAFYQRVAKVSQVENLATRSIDIPTDKQTSRSIRRRNAAATTPSSSRRLVRRRG